MLAQVTYSTKDYENARKYNVKMAYQKGKVDKVFEFCEEDLSPEFVEKNKKILSCKRGGGYWIWKPYVVKKVLDNLQEGDYLFYCDSGAFTIGDLHELTTFMKKQQTDILLFSLGCIERYWTKRDIFIELGCDTAEYTDSLQRCATYFMIKKTQKTEEFVEEWFSYAQRYELISDENNVIYHQPNYEGFQDNRHDQSLLSVLSKKYGYPSFQDISQYRYPRGWKARRCAQKKQKENADYPVLICLHRQKKADITSVIREHILCYFPQLTRVLHYGYH